MIRAWAHRAARRLDHDGADERGIAMITVIGIAAVVLGFAAVAVEQADRAVGGSTGHLSFEQGVHLAETGIDQALARLQVDDTWNTGAPGTPFPSDPSREEEEAWALAELEAAPKTTLEEGDYALVKPPDRKVIYAAGWAPGYGETERVRVVKAEYLFSSYSPARAVLTNGDLQIGGNATVEGDLGDVHANGNVEVVGGSLTISGTLSATGTVTGGDSSMESGANAQLVPEVNPRDVYDAVARNPDKTGNEWYDLCPDGTVRRPSTLPGAPCTGPVSGAAGTKFRGWEFTSGKWRNDRDPYDGIFYAYQTSVKIRGTSTRWKASILAEATGTECNLSGGDIEMTGKPDIVPFLPDLTFVAGRDLDIQGTGSGDGRYEGLLAAHEQLKVTGNPTLYGALVSEDACHTPGSPVSDNYISGSMVIHYSEELETDLFSLIRTSLWLEL